MTHGNKEKDEHEFMLEVFRTGCEKKNYEILKHLPTSVEAIMREHKLTKMPANRRVNQLVAAGLAKREYGNGKVAPTPLAYRFLDVMSALGTEVQYAVVHERARR
jgi:predicted transcriptional regulator